MAITYTYSDGTIQTVYVDMCTGLPLPVQPPCNEFIMADQFYFLSETNIAYNDGADSTLGTPPAAANRAEIQYKQTDLTGTIGTVQAVVAISTLDGTSPTAANGKAYGNLGVEVLSKEQFGLLKFKRPYVSASDFNANVRYSI